jgi:pyridoxamine 5'-phosphate oxidase
VSEFWEPFSESARRAIVLAQEAANKYKHAAIGTQHIIMGVLEVDEGPLLPQFEERALSLDTYRERLARESAQGGVPHEMVFTPNAKRLIESAFECAREWGTTYIAAEHLVAGLSRMPKSSAARYLTELGFDLSQLANAMRLQMRPSPSATLRMSRVAAVRPAYEPPELTEATIGDDPLAVLQAWIADAVAADLVEPNAMGLATADQTGQPSTRMVLLRGLDERGLVFFTSYLSRKGVELSSNPKAAALFWWGELKRQVRVEGPIEQIGEEESDAYFTSRPRDHELSAWASEQSEPLESRDALEARVADYRARFEGDLVPRPHSWGGYRLQPQRIEFWQGRQNRLHDRFEFLKDGVRWRRQRLSP